MKTAKRHLLVVLALIIGAALAVGFIKRGDFRLWSKSGGEVAPGLGTEILVMRTPGGLLEVSRITATEQFSKKFVYSVLGMDVGETVAHVRVPATYRYHIKLGSEWKIVRTDEMFTVITPPVMPSLPVAVDLKRMEEDSGGSWILVPFNEDEDLKALRREITAELAQKAGSAAYLQLQREDARKTVTEFVEKWLVKQEAWRLAKRPRIDVVFGG